MSQELGRRLADYFKADSEQLFKQMLQGSYKGGADSGRNCFCGLISGFRSIQRNYWADSERGWRNGFLLSSSIRL
jgi:hypothetical protein